MAINFPEGQQDYPGFLHRVVSDTKLDTFTTTSTSFVTISGLSATISPRSTASQILIICDLSLWAQNAQAGFVQLMRGSTPIYIGDASGNRTRNSFAGVYSHGSPTNETNQCTAVFLDTPSTTSSTTYSVRCKTINNQVCVNRSSHDPNSSDMARHSSSITLIEVDS